MIREKRYTVLKDVDVSEALDLDEIQSLAEVCEKIRLWRQKKDKQPLVCVVVESDWPEYQPTWQAIAKRVDAEVGISVMQSRLDQIDTYGID